MSMIPDNEAIRWQAEYHNNMAAKYNKALVDLENGDFWYEVQCAPAYSDVARKTPDVCVVGEKGESKNSVITKACDKFMEVYNDKRPHSIVRWVYMCFKSGLKKEMKERDPEYD